MRRFVITITAHVAEDCMLIEQNEVNEPISDFDWFGRYTHRHFPYIDWVLDDGVDDEGSNYCQYVAYTDTVQDKYLLARFYEVDENGFVI